MPNAEEPKTRDWLVESLGRLIRSRKRFTKPPPFFFDFFAAVDEGWSAMEMMRIGEKEDDARQPQGPSDKAIKLNQWFKNSKKGV